MTLNGGRHHQDSRRPPATASAKQSLRQGDQPGTAGGGANIDLASSSTTADAIDAFFPGAFGAMLDANLVTEAVNL